MTDTLRSAFSWQTLATIGQNRFFKTSYFWLFFVPVFVKMLALANSVVNLELFGTLIKLQFALPFSWQVFFFTAVMFSVGNLLFSIYCPAIIKNFRDLRQFEEQGVTERKLHLDVLNFLWKWARSNYTRWNLDYYRVYDFLRHTLSYQDRQEYFTIPMDEQTPDDGFALFVRLGERPLIIRQADVRNVFWDFRELLSLTNPIARYCVAFFYLIALTATGFLIYENILFVWDFVQNTTINP